MNTPKPDMHNALALARQYMAMSKMRPADAVVLVDDEAPELSLPANVEMPDWMCEGHALRFDHTIWVAPTITTVKTLAGEKPTLGWVVYTYITTPGGYWEPPETDYHEFGIHYSLDAAIRHALGELLDNIMRGYGESRAYTDMDVMR